VRPAWRWTPPEVSIARHSEQGLVVWVPSSALHVRLAVLHAMTLVLAARASHSRQF
jgi:hypothetical protein